MSKVVHLFTPFAQRGVTLTNRIVVAPMCLYSAGADGKPNDWHLAHLGSLAIGRSALIITEATAVEARGRIAELDLGLWNDDQIEAFERVVRFIHGEGVLVSIQLAHAGRKAFTGPRWAKVNGVGPEPAFAPSPLPYEAGWPALLERRTEEVRAIPGAFAAAARRAVAAGADLLEIHAAHGYLLHQFMSPITNKRTDEYGGGFKNRIRLTEEVCDAVRAAIPDSVPLWVRLSATDWMEWTGEPSWEPEQTVELARRLVHDHGVDLIDASSAGLDVRQRVPDYPGYQTIFADRIRREANVPTGAVGQITTPAMCEEIVANGRADVVLMGRELLRNPHFPLAAARALGADVSWPIQYLRAKL